MNRIPKWLLGGLLVMVPVVAFADCTVTTTPVSFGNYDPFAPSPLDTTGSITVNCDKIQGPPPDVTISISTSANSGVFVPRQMKHSSFPDLLNYNLYTKQNRTEVWGDGTASTSVVVIKGTQQKKVTVYGTVAPQQNVRAGLYSDNLTITISP